MPAVEVELKAADKRISGLERGLENLTKELRQSGTVALEKQLLAMEKRMTTIETIVKAMASASKAGGNVTDPGEIKKMIADAEKNMRRELQVTDKDTFENVKKLQKESDLLNLALKTVTAKQEKHAADAQAKIEKQFADQVAANMAMAKQVGEQGKQFAVMAKIEARLASVETIATSALAMAGKRN